MRMSLGSIETPFQLTPMNFNKLNSVSTGPPVSVSIDPIRPRRLVCDVNANRIEMEGRQLADVEAKTRGIPQPEA